MGERASGRGSDNTALAQSSSRLVALSSPEEYFLKAIEIARQQQAKALELRATVSLSRLWRQQDKREEARHLLASVYQWFTEGTATSDFAEATQLLHELNASAPASSRVRAG